MLSNKLDIHIVTVKREDHSLSFNWGEVGYFGHQAWGDKYVLTSWALQIWTIHQIFFPRENHFVAEQAGICKGTCDKLILSCCCCTWNTNNYYNLMGESVWVLCITYIRIKLLQCKVILRNPLHVGSLVDAVSVMSSVCSRSRWRAFIRPQPAMEAETLN